MGSVSENEDISEWVASLKICNGENFIGEFLFKIDSGACVTCMPSECYTSEMGQLNKSNVPLIGASGTSLQCMGRVYLNMQYKC